MFIIETRPLLKDDWVRITEDAWIKEIEFNSGTEVINVGIVDDIPVLFAMVYYCDKDFLKFLKKTKQDIHKYRVTIATTGDDVGSNISGPMKYRGMFVWQDKHYHVWTD